MYFLTLFSFKSKSLKCPLVGNVCVMGDGKKSSHLNKNWVCVCVRACEREIFGFFISQFLISLNFCLLLLVFNSDDMIYVNTVTMIVMNASKCVCCIE